MSYITENKYSKNKNISVERTLNLKSKLYRTKSKTLNIETRMPNAGAFYVQFFLFTLVQYIV